MQLLGPINMKEIIWRLNDNLPQQWLKMTKNSVEPHNRNPGQEDVCQLEASLSSQCFPQHPGI